MIIVSGSGVSRRSKVSLIASANFVPSKSKHRESNQMSKKSFIRLFSSPSFTIISNFSAMTLSRQYSTVLFVTSKFSVVL